VFNILADSQVQIAAQRVSTSWAWYVVRAAGFISVGLLILLMISGIGLVTGLTFRFFEPIKAWVIHRALALALCASVAIHVIFLLFDHFVPFSLVQVLVPFTATYKRMTIHGLHVGSLWVALGILSMYGIVIVVLSSLSIIERNKGIWKKLHYVSYAVMLFIFFHALYLGSDLAYGLFRYAWLALGIFLLGMVMMRLYRAGTLKNLK